MQKNAPSRFVKEVIQSTATIRVFKKETDSKTYARKILHKSLPKQVSDDNLSS